MTTQTKKATPTVQITQESLQEFTPLTDSVVRLLALLDDPTVPLQGIADVAAHDVALTTHILRLANSALYGCPHHIGTIAEAVRTIGLDQVRMLVIIGGVGHLRQKALPCYNLPSDAFGHHSELVAAVSLFLAREIGYPDPGVAYTAGLLHDIGKVALDHLGQQVGWNDTPMNQAARRGVYPMEDAERALCGQTHAQVGQRLAELWALPDEIVTAIGAHHTLEEGPGDAPLAWCVAVANSVACACDPGYPRSSQPAAPELTVDPALYAAAETVATEVLQAPEDAMNDWHIIQALRIRQRERIREEEARALAEQVASTEVERQGTRAVQHPAGPRLAPIIVGGVLIVVLVLLAVAAVAR